MKLQKKNSIVNYLKAFRIAYKAHKGQKDKGGNNYIMHPVRVSLKCKGLDSKIVALLHDVVEDTKIKIEELSLLSNDQKIALELLTHDKRVPYNIYINKIKSNEIAKEVKMNDLLDNINLSRLKKITVKDLERQKKYKNAYKTLALNN